MARTSAPIPDPKPSAPPPAHSVNPLTRSTGKTIIPPKPPTKPVPVDTTINRASRGTLARTARDLTRVQATVAGSGSIIQVLYGYQRVGAEVTFIYPGSGGIYMLCVWCAGEIDGYAGYECNDVAAPPGLFVVQQYFGTQTQTVNTLVRNILASQGKVYTDTLAGVAYTVFFVDKTLVTGFPRMCARVRGKKIRTSEFGAPVYSQVGAYMVADFIEATAADAGYGMGEKVDWASVADVAAWNTSIVGGEQRHVTNFAIDSPQPVDVWLAALCDSASCFAVKDGDTFRLIPDAPVDEADIIPIGGVGQPQVVYGTLQLSTRDTSDSPTVLETQYTDVTTLPWKTVPSDQAVAPGVGDGSVLRKVSRIPKPGIQRHSEAYRYAVQRVNDALTSDLAFQATLFDEAVKFSPGQVVALTAPVGLSSKWFRLTKVEPLSAGRWQVTGQEYDPAKYSNSVVTGPTTGDTTLPNPSYPPAPTGLVLSEEVFQQQTGRFSSRIRATWDASSYAFFRDFRVDVLKDGELIDTGTTRLNEYISPAIVENSTYTVSIYQESGFGTSTALSGNIIALGKLLKPADVPFFDGTEAGGEVRLRWLLAADLDLTATELRYGPVGGTWATATLIDRIPAPSNTYVTRAIVPGIWVFYAKELDSVHTDAFPYGQESVNAKSKTITVNTDPDLYVSDDYFWTTANLTNMELVAGVWVTSFAGDTWAGLFPGTMSTYINPIISYHTAGLSKILTETYDFGGVRSGNFTITPPAYADIDGVANVFLELSTDNLSWSEYASPGTTTQARYARMRIETTGTMKVFSLGSLRVAATTTRETGIVTTSALGPVTVTLANKYAAIKTIQLTGQQTSGGVSNPVYLNEVISNDQRYWASGYAPEDFVDNAYNPVNTFQVEAYDALGARIVSQVRWLFEGVAA